MHKKLTLQLQTSKQNNIISRQVHGVVIQTNYMFKWFFDFNSNTYLILKGQELVSRLFIVTLKWIVSPFIYILL